jgi:hypothetical protein
MIIARRLRIMFTSKVKLIISFLVSPHILFGLTLKFLPLFA